MGTKAIGIAVCCTLLALLSGGCGAIHNTARYDGTYLAPDARLAVGEVRHANAGDTGINTQKLMKDALTKALLRENMLGKPSQNGCAVMDVEIIRYEEGNAFKRWVAPNGWGPTVLSARCTLKDGKGKQLGTMDVHQAVADGGVKSMDAWKKIFHDAAREMVREFNSNRGKMAAAGE